MWDLAEEHTTARGYIVLLEDGSLYDVLNEHEVEGYPMNREGEPGPAPS